MNLETKKATYFVDVEKKNVHSHLGIRDFSVESLNTILIIKDSNLL
jgi:hypothetical protein